MKNLFVQNLAATITEHSLRSAFEPFGKVRSVTIVLDRDTGAPRGFAFIEMENEAEAAAAIAAVDGKVIDDHRVNVNEARPKEADDTTIHEQMRRHREHRY